VDVEITLNRYLDHDPQGRMYVLEEELDRVRREQAQNAAARAGEADPAVTPGLGRDAIQPLVVRVNQGECLRIRFRNGLRGGGRTGIHLHGSALRVRDGGPAIATNPQASAPPGGSVEYEWMVPRDEPEGTHYFKSPGNSREETAHGLFGAVIVEPAGSEHLDPSGRGRIHSGWAAVIRDPKGDAFREFTIVYHEIGDESEVLVARDGKGVPIVDPLTGSYRPGSRALNYRSEPFMNRLALQRSIAGTFDESVAYSSYSFGEPATPILRTYLGDPVKQRVVHGGSEVAHVHHVHGGSIRWRRQPGVEPSRFARGLDKHPPLLPQASERVDSQTIGPSETFDTENECGSGGCQQSAGDFLLHCHVAQHYFSGMWGLWRVYNTRQDAGGDLGRLVELPDRKGTVKPAVTSRQLLGTTVDWSGKEFSIAPADLGEWVERQLPPPGVPRGYDASVLDWRREGDLYLGEPDDDHVWPGYKSADPGKPSPIRFDPRTGKLAYPLLRPHLGKRPPFAPNHGPAPYLDPSSGPDPPPPGASGPASVCPEGTRVKEFHVQAISEPVVLNRKQNIVDPAGQLFVLKGQVDAVRSDPNQRVPLAIRANAGEHCVDLLLRSELADTPENNGFSKVNLHIHFVQFDVQASDGVIAGFNYEQSVRPYRSEGETIAAPTAAGATRIVLSRTERFQRGVLVGVGMDQGATFEVAEIAAVEGPVVVLTAPLRHAHGRGEVVSTEFVRYRWYPDVQFGSAYFHDHVNAVASWRHGLFGALIAEPPGATYHDPHSGAEVQSGPLADIHSPAPLSTDAKGSFRELVLFLQDDNPPTRIGRSAGGSFNLRVEPLDGRRGPPSQVFSSALHGDPETPLVEAYLGDPVVFRTLVGGTNEVHTLHVDGHWFRSEPYSGTSPPISTAHVGISERFDFVVPRAGGPQQRPADYLYYSGRSFKLREGSWGILRVLGPGAAALRPLPGHEQPPAPASTVCLSEAPRRRFAVAAVEVPLPMLRGQTGKIYVLEADRDAVVSGRKAPVPLVLRANVGDCLDVDLANQTAGPVSFHADMLAYDPATSGGVAAGGGPDQAVPSGQRRTFTYYAHPEVGETVALVRDWGDVLRNPGLGLYGAVVVGPAGARYRDPGTGGTLPVNTGWAADVRPAVGPGYRDFTLFLQDNDAGLGGHRMPYSRTVAGVVGINYAAEPIDRMAEGGDPVDSIVKAVERGLKTPVLDAVAGMPVRIHVLSPWSEQTQVFSLEGHRWPMEPGRAGTSLVSSLTVGGLEATTLSLEGGAGGPSRLPGDYLYGNARGAYFEGGQWGTLRVRPAPTAAGGGERPTVATILAGGLALVGLSALALGARRRKARAMEPDSAGGGRNPGSSRLGR
jgi:hypothetical protein